MRVEILEDTGRKGALHGNRILTLLRTDDSRADYGPIGGRPVQRSPTA